MSAVKKKKRRKRKKKSRKVVQKRETFTVIKNAVSEIGKSFSKGADKVADVVLDSSGRQKSTKGKRFKEATVSAFKDISSGIKKNLKNVKPKDVLCDASYEIGRLSRIAEDGCREIFNDLME